MKILLVVSLLLVTASPARAVDWSLDGDVRGGYYARDRDDRNGTNTQLNEWRLRIRAGLKAKLSDVLSGKIRLAGRYSTDDSNHNHFELFRSIPAGDGLRKGDSTVDELYLNYRTTGIWTLKAGRFQTKMELDGVAKKSLDRNDSPNVDITWTDGFYLKYKLVSGWMLHGILQYNYKTGATEVRRGQLDFVDSGSRWSTFLAFENKQAWGPVVQRSIDITWLPNALQRDGSSAGRIEDYLAFVGRISARWPLGRSGLKVQLSGELGYAPNTPTKVAAKTGSSGDANGTAYQVSINFLDIVPRHSFGLVYGRAGGGWLISPDFPNNMKAVEGRFRWKIGKKHKLEFRLRKREDIKLKTGSVRKREDVDYYLRYTLKF